MLGSIPSMTCGSLHVLPVAVSVSSHLNVTCSVNEYDCERMLGVGRRGRGAQIGCHASVSLPQGSCGLNVVTIIGMYG